jgi:hypothetical protein
VNRTRWLVVLLAIGWRALIGMVVAGGPSYLSREKAVEWTPPAMTSTPLSTPIPTIASGIITPTIIAPMSGATPTVPPNKPAATPVTPVPLTAPTLLSTPEAATPQSDTPVASPVRATPIASPEATLAPTDGTSID